jgi:hypothetical protein
MTQQTKSGGEVKPLTLSHHVEFLSDAWLDEARNFLIQETKRRESGLKPFSVSERFTHARPHLGFDDDVASWHVRFDGSAEHRGPESQAAIELLGLLHDHLGRRTVENPDLAHRAEQLGIADNVREMEQNGYTVIENAISAEFADEVRAATPPHCCCTTISVCSGCFTTGVRSNGLLRARS